MIEVHLRKLRARDEISAQEEQAIRGLISQVIEIPEDRTFIRHGEELHQSTLLLDGWLARAKDLPSGQRQIAELHVAGDFADLHGFTLKHLDHDLISMSRCRLALVPHDRLVELTERFPHLTRVYWFSTNLDAAIHREWTLSLGRRSALGRMAHLFCELNIRLAIADRAQNDSYEFPLTQVELGECLGLTAVHVNRTLQELRRMGLLELQNRRVSILDLKGLKGVAEFDPAYLYLEKEVR
ncbi:Crp/Fnr family transcriptional regulator [Sphingomonas agri]|uniref:Crp/Fnr family transcriptional regulator n=1 Tax=Sphingomonas agri TaxID=1813878 RepID=UPI00311EF4B1